MSDYKTESETRQLGKELVGQRQLNKSPQKSIGNRLGTSSTMKVTDGQLEGQQMDS